VKVQPLSNSPVPVKATSLSVPIAFPVAASFPVTYVTLAEPVTEFLLLEH